MDRWTGISALALLLALLLAPGAAATATAAFTEIGVIQATPITTSANVEIVLVESGGSMIITDGPAEDYIIAYLADHISTIVDKETISVEILDDTTGDAEYITIYPAAPAAEAKVIGGAASPAYGAVEEKSAARPQPAVPVLSLSRYYSQDVPSPGKTLWVDMKWEGDGDQALTVYHPGGLLGTFRDGSDGKEDGRIFLRFSREGGVGTGTWTFKMTAPLVASRENVTIQTYIE
jgi:hypothetical protein